MTAHYTLYGAPLSLYTGKTRAYLRYKQINYTEVFSSRKVYKDIIVPNTSVQFIPVVKTPDNEFIQDTAVIMDKLEEKFPERSVIPPSPKQKLVSAIIEMWADEWLLLPAMHYRWNHDNFPFIYEEFGKIALPSMPAFMRRIVGKKLGATFNRFVPLLGITQTTIPAIEDWYENHVLAILNEHFKTHNYLLGSRPCVGDFGLMGPLYAHLYRDPAPGKLMKSKAPFVAKWVERMNSTEQTKGEWLADDAIPEGLLPLIARQFIEFWPVQVDSLKQAETWIHANPNTKKLPRKLGQHQFTIGNVSENRAIRSFSQWKLQRVLDIYQQFTPLEKTAADPLLHSVGGYELMQTPINKRTYRNNNVLMAK